MNRPYGAESSFGVGDRVTNELNDEQRPQRVFEVVGITAACPAIMYASTAREKITGNPRSENCIRPPPEISQDKRETGHR